MVLFFPQELPGRRRGTRVGPNSVGYRSKGSNRTMPTAPTFQNPDDLAKSAYTNVEFEKWLNRNGQVGRRRPFARLVLTPSIQERASTTTRKRDGRGSSEGIMRSATHTYIERVAHIFPRAKHQHLSEHPRPRKHVGIRSMQSVEGNTCSISFNWTMAHHWALSRNFVYSQTPGRRQQIEHTRHISAASNRP